jgi:acyl-[acyl-carrier-protein]-phospholipid O-acyltransferase/long-chain-fatty-acid--[acyl-carrier-protein] ligase
MASRVGTVGQFLPGVEHRIEPVPGIERGGLLHVRGPNVMLGYLEDGGVLRPPASVFGEGWYNTGDVAEVDGDGFVTLLGRVRRFAKVAGEMVSLELVERIAAAASPRFEHAATSVEESGRGEAVILFTNDPALARERLQQTARQMGAPALAVPRRILCLEKIPTLSHGKKDYVLLNRMAREPEAAPRRA